MTARKVSILDLTVNQVEQLEGELGKPIDAWSEIPSRAHLYRRVYGLITGTDDASVGSMSMRELMEAVSIGDEDEDAETANPTPTPPPSG